MTILSDSPTNVNERLADKFLDMIGLRLITNREAIMEEIEQLSDEDFKKLLGFCCQLDSHIDDCICQTCRAEHGGSCLHEENEEPCEYYKPLEWLNKPNTVDLNIKEILTSTVKE